MVTLHDEGAKKESTVVFASPAAAAGVTKIAPVAPWHARRLELVYDDALGNIIRILSGNRVSTMSPTSVSATAH